LKDIDNEQSIKPEENKDAEVIKEPENMEEISSEGIIDSLFNQQEVLEDVVEENNSAQEHVVDPDDFALYKKYLG